MILGADMFRTAIFLLLLSGMSAIFAASPPEEIESELANIERQMTVFLEQSCSQERKDLCAAMKGFLNGGTPPSFSRSYYVGRLHSLQSDFKSTLDYPDTHALLLVKQSGADVGVQFERVTPESAAEKAEVMAAIASIARGQEPKAGLFTDFVKAVLREGGFSTCQIVKAAQVCVNQSANHSIVMLREHNGNLYAIAPGMVPFLPQSFDQVPGLFLAEFAVEPHKNNK
jgi:hypothetical protein